MDRRRHVVCAGGWALGAAVLLVLPDLAVVVDLLRRREGVRSGRTPGQGSPGDPATPGPVPGGARRRCCGTRACTRAA